MGRFNGIPPQQKLDGVPHFHILSLSPLVLAVVELHILNEFLLGFQLQVLVEGLDVLFLELFDERDDFLHVLGGVPDGVGEFGDEGLDELEFVADEVENIGGKVVGAEKLLLGEKEGGVGEGVAGVELVSKLQVVVGLGLLLQYGYFLIGLVCAA